jgi:UDP-glucose 4-epimerase
MLAAFAHVDGVVNLAGVLGTAETIGEEYEAAQVNILGALNVFDAFRSVPIVQIATGHEGQPNPLRAHEGLHHRPSAIARAVDGPENLRRSRVSRLRPRPEDVRAARHVEGRKIIPSFVARALTDMPIEINGDGLQVVDLVYVDDCAKVLVDALDGPYGKVLEAGTGVRVRVVDCAKDVIVACGGSKSRLVHGPMRRGEPEGAIVVASAALCRNPWPYMLDETIEWYRKKLTLAQAA